MAKTRKLEFYGYRDQNNYKTMSSSTLSDIDNLEKQIQSKIRVYLHCLN